MRHFIVASNYPDDVAIQRVGEAGEVLFMRALAYAASGDTDGFIPATQLARFGLPKITQRVNALVKEGLWDRVDGGFRVRNWWSWQSEAYAAERKRIKERNRKRAERAEDVLPTVQGQFAECPSIVGGLEEKITTTPYPPASQGGSCEGQHDNCRKCGTTHRQQERAARLWKPEWCGRCDQRTRLSNADSDTPSRCPDCHPLRASA